MAFLNEVGKVIGKAQQGLSDAAQTISTAAQETREEIAKDRQERKLQKELQRKEEQERLAEESKNALNVRRQGTVLCLLLLLYIEFYMIFLKIPVRRLD